MTKAPLFPTKSPLPYVVFGDVDEREGSKENLSVQLE